MAATILDGNRIASQIKTELTAAVRALAGSALRPGLAAILAGHNPASEIYVRNKIKACDAVGLYSEKHTFPDSVTTQDLLRLIDTLNRREEIDGILVELPLPKQVDITAVQMAIATAKDVDGFNPVNIGFVSTRRPGFAPCTPAGILEILRRSSVPIAGAYAVVVGRSNIVGRPTARLLTNHDATVTLCHSQTRNLSGLCRQAEILIVAMGRPGYVTQDFVKQGATVIDVGINRITDPAEFAKFFKANGKREQEFARKGYIVMGDVHPEVAEVAGAITPVPGGVGPLTIAMLMANTVKAAQLRRGAPALVGR